MFMASDVSWRAVQESDDGMESDYARLFKRLVPDSGLFLCFSNLVLLFLK